MNIPDTSALAWFFTCSFGITSGEQGGKRATMFFPFQFLLHLDEVLRLFAVAIASITDDHDDRFF